MISKNYMFATLALAMLRGHRRFRTDVAFRLAATVSQHSRQPKYIRLLGDLREHVLTTSNDRRPERLLTTGICVTNQAKAEYKKHNNHKQQKEEAHVASFTGNNNTTT